MSRRIVHLLPLLLLCSLLPAEVPAEAQDGAAQRWQQLAPGLAYHRLAAGAGFTLHAFRIELRRWRPVVADARKPDGRLTATVQTLAAERDAVLAVNGSFFDERRRPLGLLIEQGRELRPLRRADWGVLFVADGRAHLVHTRNFAAQSPPSQSIEFAIQVGPRLVADGKALRLKQQWAERSAIGILPDGALVVVASEGGAVESNELARLMAAPAAAGGLGCTDALMMDGGPSSQLHARVGSFRLDVPGMYGVPIAVAFVAR